MNNNEWDSMNEKDFDALLESSVSELPPEDIVKEITPWRRAIDRVLWGIVLCTITLNFLCLNYILPAIGMTLSLLGFRSLRRENKWFFACYILALIRAVCFYVSLVVNTTIYQDSIISSSAEPIYTAASLIVQLLEFICLWRGLIAVQKKSGLPAEATAAGALVIWYVIVCGLALFKYSGWIFAIAMIVVYILIIRSIVELSEEIEEAGYAIKAAPVKVSDRSLVRTILAFLIVGGALGYIFGSSYPMDWRAAEDTQTEELEEIKAQLIELGFPEYVLNDLTTEDIKACEGAIRVVADVADESVNDGITVQTQENDGYKTYITEKTVYMVRELRITGVGVQLPGEQETWMIFHHFIWILDPGFYGTESIQLWPAYGGSDGWVSGGGFSGRVLYDKDGVTYTAPYHRLSEENYASSDIIWGTRTRSDIFAEFSMPNDGENYRGYVAYTTLEAMDRRDINSWINYTHQKTWFQYPVMTAAESRMYGGSSRTFKTVQDALQFYASDDGVELLDYSN